MSARIIDGKAIAAGIRADVAERIARAGVTPGFVDVLVGDDQASATYVRMKYRAARELGIEVFDQHMPADSSREQLLKVIDELNRDPKVHGIIVQSPLPKECDADIFELQQATLPEKDVDGLHVSNQGLLAMGHPRFVPATTAGVVEMLHAADVPVEGAHVVIVGRSVLVTRPLAMLLSLKQPGLNATVTVCHTGTKDLARHTREADIIVAAAGRAKLITADMVRPGAAVIDVATNPGPDGKLVGDVDFDAVREVAGAISPVPGGVGPMTVAMLMSNIARAAGC
ncbi:MAG TPA: bifunctional 5,10-methylenetetrahydrofolate dehydrogenase/5,10-methenyltetrahydrofolate cyclohydrolase [Actinomycetota bacterium]|nr:bifunctional 5,10-methylenetetrahydrofolate dehydrogenase/5,10-methenyltetrahydrofolate cyclohydrolase [Actinomycetota bacterium]